MKRWIERIFYGILFLFTLLSALTISAAHGFPGPRLNLTPSVPRGLYLYMPGPVQRGQFVQTCLPQPLALYARSHGILGSGPCPYGMEPLVKVLAAVAGDTVTVSAHDIRINGRSWPMSAIRLHDAHSRPVSMHMKFGTHIVPEHQMLLFGLHPQSWDSRYFGALPSSAVTGRWFPLMTDKGFTL